MEAGTVPFKMESTCALKRAPPDDDDADDDYDYVIWKESMNFGVNGRNAGDAMLHRFTPTHATGTSLDLKRFRRTGSPDLLQTDKCSSLSPDYVWRQAEPS